MPRRKVPADYHVLAERRGFRWLGPEVRTTQIKTWWGCEQGHCWEAVYGSIQQGRGCPVCAGKAPKTPADYHALATERGFCWLGPEVPKVDIKTWWECAEGHRWEANYNNIQQGRGCPACGGTLPKTPPDYHALGLERGFRWLGPEVATTHDKTWWECEQEHRWETTYASIRRGTGCPFCAGVAPKTPADYHTLAEERGFRWLGPEVPNTQTKTSWECDQGHRWQAIFNSVQRGTGCPFCAGLAPKKREDYHALAEERGFRWLGPEVTGVRIKTWWQCEEGHCWEAVYDKIRQGRGCPACAGTLPKTTEDYHALAAEQGFRWLGPEVSTAHDKTSWECEEGHQWEASYSKIRYGTGCPFCAGVAPRTPEDYHALAEERGFRWLGPEVATTHDKTWWECEQEHRWETRFVYIQQGTGCPFCAGKAPKTPADYHELAAERSFRWLGPEVPKTIIKTWWECKEGHSWEAHYNNIRFGRGCPVCVDIVNGAQVSQVQRDLCAMLGGELNHPFEGYNIDVSLDFDGVAVAVEYDAWYWHGGHEEYDAQRDEEMIAAGWRVLRVRSNAQLPTRRQLDAAIDRLLAGETQVEIVLDDWGEGPTKFEID